MSLRNRLLLILGGTFILLWSLAAVWLLGDLRREVTVALDERLASSARMVAGLLEQLPQPLPSQHASPLNAIELGLQSGLVCQVRSLRGEVLVRTPNTPQATLAEYGVGFHEVSIGDERWRSFTLKRQDLWVTTADRIDERETLESAILIAAALPVALALLGSLVLIWFGIGRGLSPLQSLRTQLAQRDAEDLQPVPTQRLAKDLQPLVATLNQLFARIAAALERERRFTNDAAHELRTPLTAVKTHLQVAQMSSGDMAKHALRQAETAVDRMQSGLEQLLLLARVESAQDFDKDGQVTAQSLARYALADLIALPGYQRIEVVNELTDDVYVAVPESLAVASLRNLLDNALRYSPPDSRIELYMAVQQQRLLLRVRDTGAGLSAAQFEQAKQRFWRTASSTQSGSGLGLAIVQAVTERYGGALHLQAAPTGGLDALLYLPLSQG
ncbi:MAG: ATP-binding protein [Pseudomonas sp.]|jgi:signal transduction histidine kinase|nr:ATP-binding protein [Pseudomonas sp.]MDD2223466.1 ATP-binding protein [Pseudomonas sp.]MDY0414362.1 ATP-binding protein [Pseudomonas sp.]NLO54883.1 GHKL domain-containing protein [Gammaproteobacteria bacterium]